MSLFPALQRQNSQPYERQMASTNKRETHKNVKHRRQENKRMVSKHTRYSQSEDVSAAGAGIGRDTAYDHMSHLQRMDLAIDSYFHIIESREDIASCIKKTKATIRNIAETFGLVSKVLKQNIEYANRDHIFFETFSLEFVIEDLVNMFQFESWRFLLVTGGTERGYVPWTPSSFADDMNSSDSGSLSEQFIRDQCRENACTLESNTFVSLLNPGVKRFLIEKADELKLQHDQGVVDPLARSPSAVVPWNVKTLKSLCSVFVLLYEKNVPPTVLFTKIMKNKKANIHSCPFAFVIFDKYMVMKFPNYFHLMSSTLKDPMKVGDLLYRYAEFEDSLYSKFVNTIRIKELTSPIKLTYDEMEKDLKSNRPHR